MNEIVNKGRVLPYVILNKTNKHSYFRVKETHLEVSKSRYLTKKDVLSYINNNFDHFYNKLTLIQSKILPDNIIMLEDITHHLIITKSKTNSYQIIGDTVYVNHKKDDIDVIKKWVYKQHIINMVNKITPNINQVLKLNQIETRNIRYGYYKSKYGSYHKKNNEITLNIILAKLDINYLYYVIMHEYAHTKVFNHSRDFYKTLGDLMPNYQIYDKKLKAIAIYI